MILNQAFANDSCCRSSLIVIVFYGRAIPRDICLKGTFFYVQFAVKVVINAPATLNTFIKRNLVLEQAHGSRIIKKSTATA